MDSVVELDAGRENAVARRNAMLYAACQAFNGAAAPISISLGGLAGSYLLAADKSLATAPVTGFNVGLALAALPAAMLMRHVGRRRGFMAGAVIGIAGMLLAAHALLRHDFWLFAMGLVVTGIAAGFTQQYRFAAADRGTPDFKPKAISWVLVGGVAAAIIGPQLVLATRDMLAPVPFAGAFLAGTLLFAVSILVMSFLEPSRPAEAGQALEPVAAPAAGGRSLIEIALQPRFAVAVLCATVSYAVMSFLMTAAPLAMVGCGFSVDESTLGIQWHVMAMFAPSFFTGSLIARFGKEAIVAAGLVILAACAVVALMGIELTHFWGSLILLGIGWNFGFIGATAMVTETYRPEEKAKAQGANDMILFTTVAFASFMSGKTLNSHGWEVINLSVFPIITIALVALAWLVLRGDRNAAAA
ncbi:MAG: MFS transporter [Alphaproteobacteria bacterium]|nr:MAG: MFS transporter [Alphaproteobacteria bacterium]